MEENGKIRKLADCFHVLEQLRHKYIEAANKEESFLHGCGGRRYPYGLCFRGEPETETKLTPSIFRPRKDYDGKIVFHDEVTLFEFAIRRIPDLYPMDSKSTFELLCLMQHNGFPTRLLDWTENVLTALFFAVHYTPNKDDAWLFLLNTRKLNKLTGMQDSLRNYHTNDDFGTKFRCEFVKSLTKNDWFEALEKYDMFNWVHKTLSRYNTCGGPYFNESKTDERKHLIPLRALPEHCDPVAVLPRFTNSRMQPQRSIFTIHGGKLYDGDHLDTVIPDDQIPPPTTLLDLNSSGDFIKAYKIPAEDKYHIKKDLLACGVHEGLLFPELDKQGTTLKEMF